jgi:hypothetical protein
MKTGVNEFVWGLPKQIKEILFGKPIICTKIYPLSD